MRCGTHDFSQGIANSHSGVVGAWEQTLSVAEVRTEHGQLCWGDQGMLCRVSTEETVEDRSLGPNPVLQQGPTRRGWGWAACSVVQGR